MLHVDANYFNYRQNQNALSYYLCVINNTDYFSNNELYCTWTYSTDQAISHPEKNVAPPRKNVLDIVQKNWAPLSELFASSGVLIGPAYACYSLIIMLTSKIIKQITDILFQFYVDES